jgi:hypothetical protein
MNGNSLIGCLLASQQNKLAIKGVEVPGRQGDKIDE